MRRLSKLSRSISGKVVLITGATSGMGLATAKLFSDEGAKVVVTDLDNKKIKSVVDEITDAGNTAQGIKLDVSDKKDIEDAIKKIISNFGGLDCLINNAGISIPTTIDNENYDDYWDKTFDVLLKAQVRLIRASLPHILKSKSGVISVINNSRHCSFGYDQRVEIFGDKGMLISGNKRKYNFFIDRYKTAYKLQLEDVLNLVKKNKKPRASFEDGEKALVLANAAYKSLRSKKVVKIK